jgi:DNA repair protein RecO (recombination protein O)
MRLHSYSDWGIVLARRDFGEADRVLVVYSKENGRVSLLAKGVRKPGSRKRGHIEVFNYLKFSAAKGTGLDIVTEADGVDDFSEIRKSLKKVSLAYYFMEVIGRITHEGEPNRELFDLILASLEKLKTEKRLKRLRLDFILELLTLLGFWPRKKVLSDPDAMLAEVIERELTSIRVGKRLVL